MLTEHEQFELGDRLRMGDRAAWAALYEAYHVPVWRYVARLLGRDVAATADVTQEIFIAVARSATHFDPAKGSLWGWMAGIAHRQVALHFRKHQRATRWRELAETHSGDICRWLDVTSASRSACEQNELNELIRGVLAELSADYAALLIGKYLDDRSLEDLSVELCCSLDAIKSRLARARREFRATFDRLVGSDRTAYLS